MTLNLAWVNQRPSEFFYKCKYFYWHLNHSFWNLYWSWKSYGLSWRLTSPSLMQYKWTKSSLTEMKRESWQYLMLNIEGTIWKVSEDVQKISERNFWRSRVYFMWEGDFLLTETFLLELREQKSRKKEMWLAFQISFEYIVTSLKTLLIP